MSDNKSKVTPEYIRNLSPAEWANFRVESWKKKQQYYAGPTPEWYLKDRKSYARFIDRLNKRKQYLAQNTNADTYKGGSLTRKVEILAGDDIDTFADE
ncbi:MAG: hypothetical protein LBD63_03455 [Mycoplasmataceae bacterium]|jgi:hypothetical protein|nr:hypothetical protein [Mycoplasmataceae bacterium]